MTNTTDQTAANAVKAASDNALITAKVALELKARLEKATPSPETIKAAAEALVDTRWVDTVDVEKVAKAVADPNFALTLLTQIAQKSAEKIASLEKTPNPRLDSGSILDTKRASADTTPPVDVASQRWHEKMAGYRRQSGV